MSDYRIEVERSESTIDEGRYDDRLRVRLEVTTVEGPGLTRAVFLIRRHQELKHNGSVENVDVFQGVASPYDLSVYPETEPDEDGPHYPYFLSNVITLRFPARSTMDDVLERIRQDLNLLTERMASNETLTYTETWCFPNDECPSDSDSES